MERVLAFHFTDGERHIFRKRPRVRLSDWAASNVIVKDGPYAGGRYRKDVNPYLVGILDTWALPWTEEVDVCGSAQTGKSLVIFIALCYCVDMRPGPRMLAMQDDDAIDKTMTNKLVPTFRASPPVRSLLRKIKSASVTFKDGTSLRLASAQSPSQRASISIQDLFIDEEALYKQITGQGVPVLEFLERTRSYAHKRKVLRVSKPIGGPDCTIVRAVAEECDEVRHYEVKCPACGWPQVMTEDGLALAEKTTNPQEVERRKLGRYRCVKCKVSWTDYLRDRAVSAGEWKAEEPVNKPRKVGFHLPAILSRTVSLSEIVAAKMRAEATDSPQMKQQYANGYWARPFEAVEQATTEEQILARRDKTLPPLTVPGDVVALTAGVDVQKRGFWYGVYGWRADLSSVLIDYGRLPDWDSVHALLFETRYDYEKDCPKTGQSLGIWRAGIDSGGTRTDEDVISRTEEVYRFVRRHGAGRVFACKGSSHESHVPVRATNIDRYPSSRVRIPGGLWLYILDTFYFKSLVFARLQEDARQPMTLHSKTGEDFAVQMTAEHLVRDASGKLFWVRKRKNNHLFDCTVMAHACVDGSWLPSLLQLLERERRVEEEAKRPKSSEPPSASDRRMPSRILPGRRPLPGHARGGSEF